MKIVHRQCPFSFGITREGFLYLFFLFLLSLATINTGNNLLYMILAVLLSAMVVSGIVSRNSLKQLSLSLQMPENVFVGEKVSIKISMKNLKQIFPSFSILVEDPEQRRTHSSIAAFRSFLLRILKKSQKPEKEARSIFRQAAYFPILRPKETRSELIIQSFPKRGLYSLQGFWISTLFPFGFFHRGEHIQATGQVLVYPSIQDISAFFHLLPFIPGKLESRSMGPGDNLYSIRQYQDGESARIIDWKATAKTQKLMAREYAQEEGSKFCLILDTRIPDADKTNGGDRFERAVSAAASIAAHFADEGAGMEFLTPHEYIPRGSGIGHLYQILQSLAIVKSEIFRLPNDSDIWSPENFSVARNAEALRQIFTEKVFKIVITALPKGSFPSVIWHSAHVIFFDEL